MQSIQEWLADSAGDANLGPAATRVVEAIATRPNLAAYASTAEVAREARVNAATVVRTARQLGFSGWPAMRLELRGRYLGSLSASQLLAEHEPQVDTPASDAVRRDIENLETLLATVDPAEVGRFAAAMNAAERIVVVGSGSFAAPGLHLAYSAAYMGLDIRLERHFGTLLSNAVARLTEADCLVAVNFWQLPRDVLRAVEMASERGAATCVLTDLRNSPLGEAADLALTVPSEGVSFFPSLTASMAAVHAILAELTRLRGDRVEDAMQQIERAWGEMELFDR